MMGFLMLLLVPPMLILKWGMAVCFFFLDKLFSELTKFLTTIFCQGRKVSGGSMSFLGQKRNFLPNLICRTSILQLGLCWKGQCLVRLRVTDLFYSLLIFIFISEYHIFFFSKKGQLSVLLEILTVMVEMIS